MDQRLRRLTPVVAVVVALLLLGWISWSVDLAPEATPIPQFEPYGDETVDPTDAELASPGLTAAPSERPPPRSLPSWIGSTIIGVIAAALLALGALLLVLLARYLRNRRPADWDAIERPAAHRVSTEELRAAVQAGLSDIDAGNDPRAAVIACWLRLEQAAADADVARLAGETPADLVRRLLERHRVDDDALARLAETYRRARYAPHPVTVADRDDARATLAAVDAGLAAPTGAAS